MIAWWALTLVGLVLLGLSHAGRWHPAGDALAVGRGLLACAGLIWLAGGATLGWAHPLWLVLPGVSLGTVLWPMLRPGPRPRPQALTLYQKNLSFQLGDPAALIADIRAVDPDVITLQEVSAENEAILRALADRWPHQNLGPHPPVGGLAVLSRVPPDGSGEGARLCATCLSGLRVAGPAGPLWVVSLHLPWPWPFGQALYLAQACAALAKLKQPVLLAGDFNMVPWSHALRAVERATGSKRAGRAQGSLRLGPLPLPIDHVLAPGGARVTMRPGLGSDHRGVVARCYF